MVEKVVDRANMSCKPLESVFDGECKSSGIPISPSNFIVKMAWARQSFAEVPYIEWEVC